MNATFRDTITMEDYYMYSGTRGSGPIQVYKQRKTSFGAKTTYKHLYGNIYERIVEPRQKVIIVLE